jgi:hypothetical protein
MRRWVVLSIICTVSWLVVTSPAASEEEFERVFQADLIACGSPGFSVCYGAGGLLTLREGTIAVGEDGVVRVSLEGVAGHTQTELGPPYTFQLFFFEISAVNQPPSLTPAPLGLPFRTDARGDFDGAVAVLIGRAVGFFTVNSAGPTGSFVDFDRGAREQFISGIRTSH